MTGRPVPIAVSLGDPAGIGPELIAECWMKRKTAGLDVFFVVGGADILAAAAAARALNLPITPITSAQEALACFEQALPVLSLSADSTAYLPGQPDSDGARLALASLTLATRLAVDGEASALVTAPIAKAQLADIGFAFPGQTEFVAAACGISAEHAVMMLAGPSLRTIPLTVHCALAEVPACITQTLIITKARIVTAALKRDFGIENPRLALAALNPHAGENGRMGHEDAAILAPAVAALVAEGIDMTGPHPADALFSPRARTTYDAALCMYHDQALIPIKALDFDTGVNVTLGLPVIRTSPDHGTGFSIAGKRLADPGAMMAALRMAGQCQVRRTTYRTS